MKPAANISEKQVVSLWEKLAVPGMKFNTGSGELVKVKYPGRPGDGRGADIQDAVLEFKDKQLFGNIEIHVNASDWQSHRHHKDVAYNDNILHVVLHKDNTAPTLLADGRSIPVVALDSINPTSTRGYTGRSGSPPCRQRITAKRRHSLSSVLDEAGQLRFRQKSDYFADEIRRTSAVQCLYRGIMGALGYMKNTEIFRQLADIVPVEYLEGFRGLVNENRYRIEIQAALFGAGGLLPSQRALTNGTLHDSFVEDLERCWEHAKHPTLLSDTNWELFRVRPANHPARRLAAMAGLLAAHHKAGLLNGMTGMVFKTKAVEVVESMEKGLTVFDNLYWAEHYDFGKSCSSLGTALLGKSRKNEILTNILLPFTAAYIFSNGQGEQAIRMCRALPATEGNAISRHMMKQLGVTRELVDGALREQGLFHLYRNYCITGNCEKCPAA